MKKSWKSAFFGVLAGMMPLAASASVTADAAVADANAKESKGIVNKALAKLDTRLSEHLNISGFIVGRAQYSSAATNYGGFDIRMLRIIMSGNITKNWGYRVQTELAGGPRILDAWLEWKRYDGFQIRAGQQKRCFTYENPWSPITLGVPDYSQSVMKLAGFTDRVGEHSCGGRDAGILFSGNVIKGEKHHYLRYEVGVYNGNGINKMDDNRSKDVIGSLHVRPIQNLHIGGGYWLGKYGPQKEMVDRKRWTVGFKYDDSRYLLRGEYIASKGGKLGNPTSGLNADGWYVTGGMPVAKNLKAFVKYDVYRDNKTYESQTTKYMGALNWSVNKSIILQASYYYQDNKMPGSKNTNNAIAQMYVRF